MSALRRAGGTYAPPDLVADSCARVERRASPLAAISSVFAFCSKASRARVVFFLSSVLSSLFDDCERSLLDLLLLLDLGGGDLDLEGERDEVLREETDRVGDLLRLCAVTPASGGEDLVESL